MVERGEVKAVASRRRALALLLLPLLAAAATAGKPASAPERLVRAARSYAEQYTIYDPGYRRLSYPGGDPGGRIGVCSDLVVRSYRALGLDLQRLIHEDMARNFRLYPAARLYGQAKPDANIDHRRVPNLMTFFARRGQTLTTSLAPGDRGSWRPGDIVVFDLLDNGIPSHIGIVSDRLGGQGLPQVFHHFPPFPREEDCLTNWKVIGHYRYFPPEGG